MTTRRRPWLRVAAYAWAAPNSLIGLLAGAMVLALGGQLRLVAGVAEFHGNACTRTLRWLPQRCRFDAITFGHVIIGRNETVLTALRCHERAHVRQYERWGPLFLPAYAASSAWQWWRGGCAHEDNHFERAARAEAA